MHLSPGRQSLPEHSILPECINDENELEEVLTRPRQVLVDFIRTLPGPLLVLGAGGKMGPTLAVLARRAAACAGHELRVVAVSRFSDPAVRGRLEGQEVETLNADLLTRSDLDRLPDASQVIFLVGQKFGTTENPSLTWAINTLVPAHVMLRYPNATIVALSTGNVYPPVPVASGGAREDHLLTPLGEYANSAVARERIFEFFSRQRSTKVALLRLNYAVELRYGVLCDIAAKVAREETLELGNGYLNCIWQGDANEMILRSLALAQSPAIPWNLSGPVLRVRELAIRFGQLLGRTPRFAGQEAEIALLSNPQPLWDKLGPPVMPLDTLMRWTAAWVSRGGRTLNKPTHFEVTNGQY